MINKYLIRLFIVAVVLLTGGSVSIADSFTIRIQGRDTVTVTKKMISLADVAEITSPRVQDDETILALNRIEVAAAPAPGETVSLSAHDIIGKMQDAGVRLSDIGYAFPRVLTIKRAARTLQASEVQHAIEEYVRRTDGEATVRQVSFDGNTTVAPDARIVEVVPAAYTEGANQRFTLKTGATEQNEQRIPVSATIDRWTEVAVVRRPIPRGAVVDSGDVVMARLNVQALPMDAVNDISKIVGLETKRDLAIGEVLQRNKLDVPAIVKAGEKVTLRYRSDVIEATATGVSLDAAGLQQPIRVKNDASNKIVSGFVTAPGMVEVR